MTKTDTRTENVCTREGTINYKLAGDSRVQTIKGLFEGGLKLKYQLADLEQCFVTN